MRQSIIARSSLVCMLPFLVSCGTNVADSGGTPAVTREPEPGERFFANLQQLTFDGQNAEAYFSADGTKLIFQRQVGEESCDQQFIMNIDGSELQRVSNGLGRTTCGYFYQRDERVLYSSTFHSGESCPQPPDFSFGYVWGLFDFDIYTARSDGEDLQRLTTHEGYDAEATLSPDGSTIVFTSTRDGDLDIYTMGVDGSNVRRLTTTPGYDGGPFFSPDGSMIVYRGYHPEAAEELAAYRELLDDNLVRPSRMEIWIMNTDGSGQRQVTNLGGANFAPYFHPDGNRILFSSNHASTDGRDFDLYLVDMDGSNLERVTTNGDFDGFPMFSPDGTKLVFASNRHGVEVGDTNIFIADWVER